MRDLFLELEDQLRIQSISTSKFHVFIPGATPVEVASSLWTTILQSEWPIFLLMRYLVDIHSSHDVLLEPVSSRVGLAPNNDFLLHDIERAGEEQEQHSAEGFGEDGAAKHIKGIESRLLKKNLANKIFVYLARCEF